ncbi:MAG: type II secretion system protein GspC [Gammaproteobacteria bacterium]|nr:type II secretion system protein GspC [Gammaproteobacteria bacterium]
MNSIVSTVNKESVRKLTSDLLLSPKTATIVSWILLLMIVYLTSLFAWSIWDYFQPRQKITIPAIVSSANKPTLEVNIQKLTRYNLFGDSKVPVTDSNNDEIDAPVTRLKLKLRGVYAATEVALAGAMIEANNKQDLYRVGSNLPGAAGLKLHKIFADRVIMSRNNKYETLLIEDFAAGSTSHSKGRTTTQSKIRENTQNKIRENISPAAADNKVIDRRKDKKLSRDLLKLRSKLTDPQSLSELISISPAMSEGEFQGFRLTPGKNRVLFGRMGLRRNDVLTEINGINLGDPSSSFSLMEQISNAEEITMSINRGGRNMSILFNTKVQ